MTSRFDVAQEPMLTMFKHEEELEFMLQYARSRRFLNAQDLQRVTVQPRVVILAPRHRERAPWRPWEV